MGPTEVADALHGLADACGGFGVDDRKHDGVMVLQGTRNLRRAEGLAPGTFDGEDIGSVAAGHVGEAQAEVTVDRHHHPVTGFDHVGDGGFHGSTTGATHGQGEPVIGLPGVTQQLLHLHHQLQVQRIEVTDRHASEGFQHLGMGVGGSGTEQQSFRCGNGGEPNSVLVRDVRQNRKGQGLRAEETGEGRVGEGVPAQRALTLVEARPRQRCRKGARTTLSINLASPPPWLSNISETTSASRAMPRTVGPVGTPRLL